jgi:ribosomal protein S27AE
MGGVGSAVEYKTTFNFWALLLIGYVPVCFAVTLLSAHWLGTYTPGVMLAALWMAAFITTGIKLVYWECDKCGYIYGLIYPSPDSCPNCDIMARQQRRAA